ncbi:TPA_exp: putative Rad2-like endonuclease [Trichophyton benhamiae CBS 112371]|nr:TPA_exp: putative Rad2-like endonuclease [Trichophyton benhamiae CBS 112371]
MGIPGLKDELGPGERISLARYSVGHLQRTRKPLRLAVDISIWLFQVQAAQGGTNPALRTLFFRLTRLISLPIQPIFVFDGPHRPDYKRGRLVSKNAAAAQIELSRKLIELFSYPCHMAPGEAEAECAKLQQAGVVDAVMSNDVDALMFGSKVTLLNYSKGSAKQSGAATHVDLYNTEAEDGDSKVTLDTRGMVLVALLSGGDYSPAGVALCGPKLAVEIARAGFGEDLLEITQDLLSGRSTKKAEEALCEWRERLQYELQSNESGYFKTKHKAVKIPADFPNLAALRSCVDPVTSSLKEMDALRRSDIWGRRVDVDRLRAFVGKYLGWKNAIGAKNLIRKLAPSLLSYNLFYSSLGTPKDKLPLKILGYKSADSFDALPVLKLEYVPLQIVNVDLDQETTTASPQEEEVMNIDSSDNDDTPKESHAMVRKSTLAEYDPSASQKAWLFETIVRRGIPDTVDDWFAECKKKEAAKKRPVKKSEARKKKPKVVDPGMKAGSILRYGTITKGPVIQRNATSSLAKESPPSSNHSLPYSDIAGTQKPPISSGKSTDLPASSEFIDLTFSDPLDDPVGSDHTQDRKDLALSHVHISEKMLPGSTRPDIVCAPSQKRKIPKCKERIPAPSVQPNEPKLPKEKKAITKSPSPLPSYSTTQEFPSLNQLSIELENIYNMNPPGDTRTRHQKTDRHILYRDNGPPAPEGIMDAFKPEMIFCEHRPPALHVKIDNGFWTQVQGATTDCPCLLSSEKNSSLNCLSGRPICLGYVSIVDLT